MIKKIQYLFLLLSLLAGFALRFHLHMAAEREIRWDGVWYWGAAQNILQGKFEADCCDHGTGYPLSIAPLLILFGKHHAEIIRIFQGILDITTGVLLGYTGFQLLGAWPGLLIFSAYHINPFTAPYTGFFLTEVLTFFIITLLFGMYARKDFMTNPSVWLLQGIVLGYLFFTKPGFIWFVLYSIGLFALFGIRQIRQKLRYMLYSCIGISIVSLLPLLANYLTFGTMSLTPLYGNTWGTLYVAMYEGISPEIQSDFWPHHPIWEAAIAEYWNTYLVGNDAYNEKYKSLYLSKVAKEWPDYLRIIGRNMIFFWDKRHFYISPSQYHPLDVLPMRILNSITWLLGIVGIVSYMKKRNANKPILIFSFGLFTYMNFVFTLVSNMSRHSLPFYPVLLFWTGYGIYTILKKLGGTLANNQH